MRDSFITSNFCFMNGQIGKDQSGDNEEKVVTDKKHINPFENHQSAEKDIADSAEEIEKEQQFKEAQSERD